MKEKIVRWVKANPHCLALLYFVVYVIWFFGLEFFREPVYWITCPLDAYIPFNEYFVIPYGLWFPYFLGALAFFMLKEKTLFLKLCFVMFTGMTICLLIYTIWPNAIDLRQEITRDNLFSQIVALLRTVDTSTNVCPSIHVASTVAVHWAICRYNGFRKPLLTKGISFLLAVGICASTVFLKQHSIVDVFWGVVLTAALILVLLLWERKGRILPKAAPQHLNRG
ncbi:MAG: phosphatase PAP2 family protein [Oscillospiraceae bacterium]|nr:phosphatase PAP2 family protein [Oscillospiraceae bacterium]